jgi:hypothetical protein
MIGETVTNSYEIRKLSYIYMYNYVLASRFHPLTPTHQYTHSTGI